MNMPSTAYASNMQTMMAMGGKSSVTTQSANVAGKPAKPRKRTNRNTPHTSVKIITVRRAVSISASRSRPVIWRRARRRYACQTYMAKTTIAPKAPASVGVATPE